MSDASVLQGEPALRATTWPGALLDWLGRHDRAVMLAGGGLQIVVLVAMMVTHLMTLLTGETILLHVVPVDPRDLFRGDYVILSYEFSRLPSGGVQGENLSELYGQTVYATLVPDEDGKHWRMGEFSLTKPSSGKFLRGKVTSWGRVEYGIESFFVQEGTGRAYEQAARSRKLSVEVVVDNSGRGVLKRLVID